MSATSSSARSRRHCDVTTSKRGRVWRSTIQCRRSESIVASCTMMRFSSGSPAAACTKAWMLAANPSRVPQLGFPLAEVFAHRAVESLEEVVDRGLPQRLLRLEVIVDLRLMRSRCGSDPTGRRPLETVRRELGQRGVEQRRSGGRGACLSLAEGQSSLRSRRPWVAIIYHSDLICPVHGAPPTHIHHARGSGRRRVHGRSSTTSDSPATDVLVHPRRRRAARVGPLRHPIARSSRRRDR